MTTLEKLNRLARLAHYYKELNNAPMVVTVLIKYNELAKQL